MTEILDVKAGIEAENDKYAVKVRALTGSRGIFLINLMASPGAGKTTLLLRTIDALKEKYRIAVIEADVDADVDAKAVASHGVKALQLHTGGSCHMDARMTLNGLEALDPDAYDVIILENVGNLVCPAEFDVGADLKVMILSVPEGDDKPLKYPLMFTVTDCLLINKIDCASIFDFDIQKCRKNVEPLNPDVTILPLSAKTGEGIDAWISWLEEKINTSKRMEK